MKSLLPCVLLLGAAASGAEPLPPGPVALDRASITIPYTELRALWEAAHRKPVPPVADRSPVAFVIGSIDCELRLGERASTMTAQFEVETLDAKWQSILLLGGADARLEKVEAAGSSVVSDQGYKLLANQPGKTNAKLTLSLPGMGTVGTVETMGLEFGAATVKRLRVAGIQAGREVRVNGHRASELVEGVAVFPLAGEAGAVIIEVSAPRPEPPPKVERPLQPSHWRLQSQLLVRPQEARLEYTGRLYLHAEDGSGVEAELLLPPGTASFAVRGEDLEEQTQARRDDGQRTLHLRWKTRDLLDRELQVSYATPQPPLAEEWKLAAPAIPEQPEAQHFYGLIPAEGLELKGAELRPAIGAHQLPRWMREEIGTAGFLVAEAGAQLALKAHWLPRVETAQATVSAAKCHLRLVADGSMQTEATYTIAHEAPMAVRLELPAGVDLLSCAVQGKPARPVQREAGAIELSLPAPGKGATTVALLYVAKREALDPVSGNIALELPRTALFIDKLEWSVLLPGVFEINAMQGNVEAGAAPIGPTAPAEETALQFRKNLCRGERPTVELFYQRRVSEK